MVLLVLVIGGVAVFCFSYGYILIGIICLGGCSKKFGWPALFITTIFLFIKGHWFVGSLPLLLIGWNIIGLKLFYKDVKMQGITKEGDAGDVITNFFDYCIDYLSNRSRLSNEQSVLLSLDPELGLDLDKAKLQWIHKDLGMGIDPDIFLVSRLYDAPQMKSINVILDKYATEYSQREQNIKNYLKSIGHPLGYS